MAARLKRVEENLEAAMGQLDQRPVIPYNRMAEWGTNGRIKPDAAIHSPFIRRKQYLTLE